MSDNEGSMTVSAPGGGGSGRPTGGNGNNGGNGSKSGSGGSSTTDGKASAVFGMPAVAVPVNGVWGITLFDSAAIASEITAAIAVVDKAIAAAPYAARLSGVFGLLSPSPLGKAKVSIDVKSLVMTALPATKVLSSQVSTLPTQAATVQVNKRITDEVAGGRQHLVVSGVKGLPQSVPVVDAKSTGKPGVFSAAVVPGLAPMQIAISKALPSGIQSLSKTVTSEKDDARPTGFTGNSGTRDAIVRFPPGTNAQPVYVSVTDILSETELRKREDLEKLRRTEWDASHPLEVAQKAFDIAQRELRQVDDNIKSLQAVVAADIKTVEHFKKMTEVKSSSPSFRDQVNISYNRSKSILAENEKKLNLALESRKAKDKNKKDTEAKLEVEKKKPRKGVKEYGHDYLPAPKTEEIKGLGELKRAPKRTPVRGGGGLRDRWKGDKGRTIYEWDSQHGELEGYRASDGQHIGAFDVKTGKQVKEPLAKRNIKDYL